MKQFNTTAVCIPSKHYMVDLTDRLVAIREMIDEGKYFTINRARQYGKTTTLAALKKSIEHEYVVLMLDFQGIGNSGFSSEETFVQEFSRLILKRIKIDSLIVNDRIKTALEEWRDTKTPVTRLGELFDVLMDWCEDSDRGIVLMIDEVDSATNNQVFLDFLAQLRDKYISRDVDDITTFQSVILAGVTDVKHLKSRIRGESESKQNSPWNIAADFTVDMSLSEEGIRGMLDEYESDHHTGMDSAVMAKMIREYTNGYPFLVSRICQLIDTQVCKSMTPHNAWSRNGVDEAVKGILAEKSMLFESLSVKLNNYPELKSSLRNVLMEGEKLTWNMYQNDIAQMYMYGFIRNENNAVRIDNRIFETWLYNLFLSDEEMKNNVFSKAGDLGRNQFVEDGTLNMRLILERFIDTYTEVFGPLEDRFKEKDGRELFLLYLKPIINGTGNYYIEAQTRDQTRTDVIVDYLGQQYIIELKIWRGERYNESGEKQILGYLEHFGLTTGYMLSFNFNKKKTTGVTRVQIEDRVLYEGMI